MDKPKTRKEENRDFFWSMVEPKCILCGYGERICNLESHHIVLGSKWDKNDSLGAWICQSRHKMLRSITTTKFTVLCRNCHGAVHEDLRKKVEVNLEPLNTKKFYVMWLEMERESDRLKEVKEEELREKELRKKARMEPVVKTQPPPPLPPPPPPMRQIREGVGPVRNPTINKKLKTIHGSAIGLETPEEIGMMNEMIKLYDMNIKKTTLFDDTISYMVDTKVHGPDMKPEHLALFRKVIFWHHDEFIESMKNHNREEQRKKEARAAFGY